MELVKIGKKTNVQNFINMIVLTTIKKYLAKNILWKKRPCVQKYYEYKDLVRLHKVRVPEAGHHIIFVLSMPKGWSKKKREAMNGKPHQNKLDLDNLLKALYDSVYEEDKHIWDTRVTKIWGKNGKIIIKKMSPANELKK
jgi:hypothetical protein